MLLKYGISVANKPFANINVAASVLVSSWYYWYLFACNLTYRELCFLYSFLSSPDQMIFE